MFKKIMPQSAIGRLYVGIVAVSAAIGITFTVTSLAVDRLLD